MTIKESLIWATKKLKNLSPALDAEILLAFTLKKPKEFLYAHSEKTLTTAQFLKFKKFIARRAKHDPIAYIIGHKYFYDLDFFVNKKVLIPRPETEILVENTINKNPTAIIDVGIGSGAIAVSLAHRLPNAKIFATEISSAALKVAQKNISHHKVAVTLLCGNLLKPLLKKSKITNLKSLTIAANLPYLMTNQWKKTPPEIKKYEPRQALDGGTDGLKYYRELLQQLELLITGRRLSITSFFEIDPYQKKSIVKLIKRRFPTAKIKIKKDLAGRARLVIFEI